MGSFDCYCALCSGPLGKRWVVFGSKQTKWLTRRRRRVDVKKRRLAGEKVDESDEDEDMEDGHAEADVAVEENGLETSASHDALRSITESRDPDTTHDLEIAMALDQTGSEAGSEAGSVDNETDDMDEIDEDYTYGKFTHAMSAILAPEDCKLTCSLRDC